MDIGQLRKEVYGHIRQQQFSQAEDSLLAVKSFFAGKALGRWYFLFAETVLWSRPDDHTTFGEACTYACRLLQQDHEGLCALYLLQMAVAIRRGEWHQAKIYIRRIRAMLRRHPTEYEIQRLQGSVLINEGLVERATGNFTRAISLLLKGIADVKKYLHPPDERPRQILIVMSYLEVADIYLRLGQRGKALEMLAKVDPADIHDKEQGRYCYVQARYWLALGSVDRAEEWLGRVGNRSSWDPDWPALLLEVRAGIARLRNQADVAIDLLKEALEHATQRNNHILASALEYELGHLEGRD